MKVPSAGGGLDVDAVPRREDQGGSARARAAAASKPGGSVLVDARDVEHAAGDGCVHAGAMTTLTGVPADRERPRRERESVGLLDAVEHDGEDEDWPCGSASRRRCIARGGRTSNQGLRKAVKASREARAP